MTFIQEKKSSRLYRSIYQLNHGFIENIMKVFMDDVREAPEGWTRTYNIEETKALLLTRQVISLSLDNDLGSLDPKTEGHHVLSFLEEVINDDMTFPIPVMTVHSSNAARAQSMSQTIKRLELIRQQQIGGS